MLSKKAKIILWVSISVVLLALIGVGAWLLGYYLPYNAAQNTMDPNGIVTVSTDTNGKISISWPKGTNVENYKVQVLDSDGAQLHTCSTGIANSLVLPQLPTDRTLRIRIESSCRYGEKVRPGDAALEVQLKLASPEIKDLVWDPDPNTTKVHITFDMSQGQLCKVLMDTGDGKPKVAEELTEGKIVLDFSEKGKYTVPAHGQELTFSFQLEKNSNQVLYRGNITEGFTLTREHLLGNVLNTQCTDNGENSYTLTWNETKGEFYEVRFSDNDGLSWQTLKVIPNGEERSYTTAHLDPFADYQLWVVAVGGQTLPDSEFAAHSEPVKVTTGARLLYSTIWPLMDQPIYKSPAATEELGTAAAGSAWCLLGMEGQYMKVRYKGQDGYIDSNYCMINLPEYIGELCMYDITNSYSSIYLVHEYGISRVSGTVITGYEDINIGDGEYLAPFLFPSAQKLIKAGLDARSQGYTLKIYDSFRPKNATDNIYSLTGAILDNPVPVNTYSGKRVTDLDLLDWEPEEEGEDSTDTPGDPSLYPPSSNTNPTDPPTTDPNPSEPPATGTEPPDTGTETPGTGTETPTEDTGSKKKNIFFTEKEPWPGLMEGLTYRILMTNDGEYSLGAFLAPGNSKHNFGIALDLTLVDSSGKELSMQTSMHDLSWYSASKRNNGNAHTLYRIMTGAGFKDLYSEWWHFQDQEIFDTNKYEPLKPGVSWECWVLDETGWRYRRANGSFYTSCTQTIDGVQYTFDQNGYTEY